MRAPITGCPHPPPLPPRSRVSLLRGAIFNLSLQTQGNSHILILAELPQVLHLEPGATPLIVPGAASLLPSPSLSERGGSRAAGQDSGPLRSL